MFILPQEVSNKYIKEMETYLHDLLYSFQLKGSAVNWARLIEVMSFNGESLIKKIIVEYLEKMDRDFKDSKIRYDTYLVKDYLPRTLITMFGEITYSRTIYTNRNTGERYIYVDRKMGISPYIRYTHDIRSYAYEAYADENSMIKVGKELGSLIHSKFSLKRNNEYALSRQTIYNFLKLKPIHYVPDTKRSCERLFILLDEKFIGCQDLNKKIMSKVCMVYEGVERKEKRNHLINKTFFTSYSDTFKYDLLTYLDEIYELDDIKQIYCMGDGGAWIKETFKELRIPGVKQIVCLDKFHAYKALYDLCKEYTPYQIALYYISRSDYDSFKKSIKHFIRDKKDEDNYKYLINNFKEVVNMYYALGPCAMEQCISHHVMSEFISVPKAYTSVNIERYLSMRDNYRNGLNLKEIYLEAIDSDMKDKDMIVINEKRLNLSIFDKKSDIPYYSVENLKGKLRFLPY